MPRKKSSKWWDSPWNVFSGCPPDGQHSPACRNCYARRLHKRLALTGAGRYQHPFDEFHVREDMLQVEGPERAAPLRWRRPRTVFVNNMSDTFHLSAPTETILRLFDIMTVAEQHTFLVLTKRSERMLQVTERIGAWPPNVWAGVTVESPAYLWRLHHLCEVPAGVRFVSAEPLLGSLHRDITERQWRHLDWLIVGGETGPAEVQPQKANYFEVQELKKLAGEWGVKYYFKQWGGGARPDDGMLDDEYVRERPETLGELGLLEGAQRPQTLAELGLLEGPQCPARRE